MDCDFFQCEEFNKYRINEPYPSTEGVCPNSYYARLVSDAYAGRGSEMTAITQYSFHNLYTGEYPEVYTAIRYIAFVEMIHLRLLGELLTRLNFIPRYFSCQTGNFWNGSFPDSHIKIAEMLAADIAGEHDAIDHYKRLICQIKDIKMQDLFKRIILDEEKHIEVLTPFYNQYRK